VNSLDRSLPLFFSVLGRCEGTAMNMWSRAVLWLCVAGRIGLGCVFVVAAIQKLYQPYDFLSKVYEYSLFTPLMGLAVAAAIPWIELVVGVALICDFLTRGALVAASALLGVFTALKVSLLWRGLPVTCGCLGSMSASEVSVVEVLWTAGMLVGTLALGWNDHARATRQEATPLTRQACEDGGTRRISAPGPC